MKNLFILLLLFSFACKKESGDSSTGSETSEAPVVTTPTPPTPTNPTPTWTEEFVELVNEHRISIGRAPLIHSEEMARIAETHSKNMAAGTVAFGHDGFSSRCSSARSALGGGNWCAENVAKGQKTPQAAFNSWINSSGHRANIESSRATHMGFGYAKSSSGTYLWTQLFLEL